MTRHIEDILRDKEFLKKIERLKKLYPEERSALLASLHLCQSEAGFVPREFQQWIAEELHLSSAHVKGVVTFYEMFWDRPKGQYLIQVCKTLPCMLAGAETLLDHISTKLGVAPGQTTKDGRYTLITVECLACCDKGPSMMINDNLHTRVSPADFDTIIRELE